MIALVFALLLQAQPSSANPLETDTWAHVRLDGWTYRGATIENDALFFSRTPPGDQDNLIWWRGEIQERKDTGMRSYRELYEVDCELGRSRGLSFESFSSPNLSGTVLDRNDETETWQHPEPGTIAEFTLEAACE